MTLSKDIIGCKNCLGEWIEAKKVKKAIKELKECFDSGSNYPGVLIFDNIDRIFGKELCEEAKG